MSLRHSPGSSIELSLEIAGGKCVLSFDLDVTKIIKSVEDDAAGAIAGMCLPAWNALLLNDIRFQSSSVCTNITPHLLATLTRIFKGTTRNSFKGLRSRLICQEMALSYYDNRQSCNTSGISGILQIGGQDYGRHSSERAGSGIALGPRSSIAVCTFPDTMCSPPSIGDGPSRRTFDRYPFLSSSPLPFDVSLS